MVISFLPQGSFFLSKKPKIAHCRMHTVDIANKLLMQLPWKNEAVFTRLCYFGENFQWKLIAVKGKSGLMEVFDWVWVF